MPRVPQEHLDARRRQILDAARRRFAIDGFHATSMQDVLTEARLSAGAVYRYFPSKESIIEAIAVEVTATISEVVLGDAWSTSPPPLADLLPRLLAAFSDVDLADELASVAIQVWAEALRSPTLAGVFDLGMRRIEQIGIPIVEAYQRRGELPADLDPREAVRAFVGVVQGFFVQHRVGKVSPEAYGRGMFALAQALSARHAAGA
jgi:AcrR family transcriptional regulator